MSGNSWTQHPVSVLHQQSRAAYLHRQQARASYLLLRHGLKFPTTFSNVSYVHDLTGDEETSNHNNSSSLNNPVEYNRRGGGGNRRSWEEWIEIILFYKTYRAHNGNLNKRRLAVEKEFGVGAFAVSANISMSKRVSNTMFFKEKLEAEHLRGKLDVLERKFQRLEDPDGAVAQSLKCQMRVVIGKILDHRETIRKTFVVNAVNNNNDNNDNRPSALLQKEGSAVRLGSATSQLALLSVAGDLRDDRWTTNRHLTNAANKICAVPERAAFGEPTTFAVSRRRQSTRSRKTQKKETNTILKSECEKAAADKICAVPDPAAFGEPTTFVVSRQRQSTRSRKTRKKETNTILESDWKKASADREIQVIQKLYKELNCRIRDQRCFTSLDEFRTTVADKIGLPYKHQTDSGEILSVSHTSSNSTPARVSSSMQGGGHGEDESRSRTGEERAKRENYQTSDTEHAKKKQCTETAALSGPTQNGCSESAQALSPGR